MQAIIAGAQGRWRPLILVAIFCGLRASELRGLRWADVDFDAKQLNLKQRADASHKIGKLKSKAGYRSIPSPPIVLNALREWKLLCPKGDLGFPQRDRQGRIPRQYFRPWAGANPEGRRADRNAAVNGSARKPVLSAAGEPVMVEAGKYGMHSLRHACASLWIDSGFNPKQIQTLMGHSSIKVTFDVYGHLFADADADQKAAEGVQFRLLGV